MTDVADLADLRLTEWTACGGCAAKWGAAPLGQLVRDLAGSADPAPARRASRRSTTPPSTG